MRGSFSLGCLLLTATSAGAETVTVHITDLAFVPSEVRVKPGDVVEWVNDDFIAHSATDENANKAADKAAFNIEVGPEAKGSFKVGAAGTFDYFCRYHPNMKGRIVSAP